MGAIHEANHGTLFLDEIDSLPKGIQTKLLFFLDSKKVRPVGGFGEKKSNANLIFAAGRDLWKLVKEGKMRKDFYFRISSGLEYHLRPLREDRNLLRKLIYEYEQKNAITLSPNLLKFYLKYSWPGNIRQLYGHLDKKTALSKSARMYFNSLDNSLLRLHHPSVPEGFLSLQSLKAHYAQKVYYWTGQNSKEAAYILDVSINTFRNLLKSSIEDERI